MFSFYVFFFNDTATTEIYTLSLHDALPIFDVVGEVERAGGLLAGVPEHPDRLAVGGGHGHVHRVLHPVAPRSEEHTSELQSRQYLVCRLLLEKKKQHITHYPTYDGVSRLPT